MVIRSAHDVHDVELAKSFGWSVAMDLSIEVVGRNVKKHKDIEGHKKVALILC